MSDQKKGNSFQKIGSLVPTPNSGPSISSERISTSGGLKASVTTGFPRPDAMLSSRTGTELTRTGSETRSTTVRSNPSAHLLCLPIEQVSSVALTLAEKGNPPSPPHLLVEWEAWDSLPFHPAEIEAMAASLDVLLEPADPRKGAAVMEKTLELYGVPDNWDRIVDFYLEAIEDLPLDIIIDLFRTIRMNLKWFPKPSEIRGHIAAAYWLRRAARAKVKLMLAKMEQPYQVAEQKRL